jgi:hypothetical protein
VFFVEKPTKVDAAVVVMAGRLCNKVGQAAMQREREICCPSLLTLTCKH